MAYGRIYIENLRQKVTLLFDKLKADNRLGEANFIEAFKKAYPRDYAMLQYEWEFKVHEFKKNRKGNPKPHPIRPDKILLNMYRNYYFKLIKKPIIQGNKGKQLGEIRVIAGQCGYKIKVDNGKYNIINKETKGIAYENITLGRLKEIFSQQNVCRMKKEMEDRKSG